MKLRSLAALIGLSLYSFAASGQAPPCRPCAGLHVDDPADVLAELAAPPSLEDDSRLYVSWDAELDGSHVPDAAPVVEAGAIPWVVAIFRTPSPLTGHLDSLESELQRAAEVAAAAGASGHLQIEWRPPGEAVQPDPSELAFLLKRAAVAITGAQPEARVILGGLEPDPGLLSDLWAEDISAYIEGAALRPADDETLVAAVELLQQLDPGRPLVLSHVPLPEAPAEVLASAAHFAQAGFAAVLFEGEEPAERIRPLKLLAREFAGDLSPDPYSEPTGELSGWAFVRGSDLGLRVIVRPGSPPDELRVTFPDSSLRNPALVDPETGEATTLYATRGANGLEVYLPEPGAAAVLRLDRLTASELEGIEGLDEQLTVLDERQMPVAEILRRLQAFEDAQARQLDRYYATNTSHLRFQLGTGTGSFEATFLGDYFYQQGGGFDWVWREFLANGVEWRSGKIPEIPLIQPEKAASLPVEISFTREYKYSLRGTASVEGRDCWVVDFEPVGAVTEGRSLFQGTVWVDRQIYARVKTRAVQLGLAGEVLSNEETTFFAPLDAGGQPAAWAPSSYFLPVRLVGQQVWSVLSATTVVEREILLTDVTINPEDFDERRQAMLDSEYTMVRDTEAGLRYLIVDEETGERVVQENPDTKRRFLVGGVFYDESQEFPLPLAGFNWLWFDFRGTGTQANIFLAGPLVNLAITDPSFRDSKWDVGADTFFLAIANSDEVYRAGREVPAEEVEVFSPSVDFKIGRPLGNFAKVELEYELEWTKYDRADDTAADFVLPTDHFLHSFSLTTRYNRGGYRFRLGGSHHVRDDWKPWGLPGNPGFSPDHESYNRWQAGIGKTWHLPKFLKFGAELEYVDGSNLDRFSKYEFGFFSDVRVAGYQSDRVRAEEALAAHLNYGFDLGSVIRLGLRTDLAWATDTESGLDHELLGGVGIAGTLVGPWQTLVRLDVGKAVEGPDDGFSAFVAFLKLFD